MRTAFESYVRKFYGERYNLTTDRDGYYASEIVKRMYDVWCHTRQGN